MDLPLKTDKLTKRQTEVASCLAQGLSRAQITKKLFIEDGTLSEHCRNLSKKWGMQKASTPALQAEAKRRGYGETQN